MSYRNDPYDPKQVAAARPRRRSPRRSRAAGRRSRRPATWTRSAALKPAHLGDRVAGVAGPPGARRAAAGTRRPTPASASTGPRRHPGRATTRGWPSWRPSATRGCWSRRRVDVTLPWDRRPRGARHPLTTLMERIADLFVGMGYEVAEGPEVGARVAELRRPQHRRRTTRRAAMMDTFFVDPPEAGLVLRTHTSPVQARTMLSREPPIYVVVPGPGRTAPTSSTPRTRPVFHQVEGLVVDKGITMAHLRGTLDHFARAMFGADARTRWRPHYFPFTEPSAEFDVWFPAAPRRPAVGRVGRLRHGQPAGAASPAASTRSEYSGFAFGMGIERTLMFRTGSRTCATWSRATCGSPARSGWRSDACASRCRGCASTSSCPRR